MQEKYRLQIENMSHANREILLQKLDLPGYPPCAFDVIEAAGLDHAAVILRLMREGSREALGLSERLLDKPITYLPTTYEMPSVSSLWARARWAARSLGLDSECDSDERRVVRIDRNHRLPTTDSFQRYRHLKVGMTVQQFLTRGGTRRDLREWSKEGVLELGI